MKAHELRSIFPHASPDTVRRNAADAPGDPGAPTKLERDPRHGALGKVQVQRRTRRRFLVIVTAVRERLLDEDNLCEKFHVDLCRYAGVILGDEAGTTRIETCQRKAYGDEEEHIIIEVYEIPLTLELPSKGAIWADLLAAATQPAAGN